MTLRDKKIFFRNENEKLMKKVKFGNLIMPHFSANGELKGFELKDELIPLLYINN